MKRIWSIILCCTANLVLSQVEITDAGMLGCLVNSYPQVMMSNTQLDTTVSKTINSLSCNNRSIVDISILKYFNRARVIELDNNNITDLSVLSQLSGLGSISVKNNRLTSVPVFTELNSLLVFNADGNEITDFPVLPRLIREVHLSRNLIQGNLDLSIHPVIEKLSLDDNKIDTLTGILTLTNLQELYVSRNGLKSIESFQNSLSISKVVLEDNQLVEVNGLKGKPKLVELNLNKNQLTNISLTGIAPVAVVSIQGNSFTFEDIEPLNEIFTNVSGTLHYESQNNINLDSIVTINYGNDFEWVLGFDLGVSSNTYDWFRDGELVETTNIGSLIMNTSGEYTCIVSNSKLPDLQLTVQSVTLIVLNNNSTPLAFSPDNNGSSDTFYFQQDGEITIYDRFSNLIRNENGPFEWDGTNQNGQILPVGVYVVKLNGEFWNQVTIIK